MRYAIDTEFIDDGKTIDLLSLGIVSEDGAPLYIQNLDCDISKASPWVIEHVLPQLVTCPTGTMNDHRQPTYAQNAMACHSPECPWLYYHDIGEAVKNFIGFTGTSHRPEFWGYFCAYDWVAFCQLFGPMVNLPKGWPRYCRDLKQWSVWYGDIRFEKPPDMPHNAAGDALWIMAMLKRYVFGEAQHATG